MESTRVPLPPGVRVPYAVYLNGVAQRAGADYVVERAALIFPRALRSDVVSKRRWLLGAWGVGTYRQDDAVDVSWTGADGAPRMAHRLALEPIRAEGGPD